MVFVPQSHLATPVLSLHPSPTHSLCDGSSQRLVGRKFLFPPALRLKGAVVTGSPQSNINPCSGDKGHGHCVDM